VLRWRAWVTSPVRVVPAALNSKDGLTSRLPRSRKVSPNFMARLEAVERTAKRQTAPAQEEASKAGRKSGDQHGDHGHRRPPDPASIDEILDAKCPDACLQCSGDVEKTPIDAIHQDEIPRRPIHRRFPLRKMLPLRQDVSRPTSPANLRCDRRRRQPDRPDAQAAVVYLNKRAGLSFGKIADFFGQCFGIRITRGAASQIVTRADPRLEPACKEITEQLKNASHITPDETCWRIGGRSVWLHAWVGDNGSTLYRVDPQRVPRSSRPSSTSIGRAA
jgi:transposase